jgi:uncharacterized protein (DUF983 family)
LQVVEQDQEDKVEQLPQQLVVVVLEMVVVLVAMLLQTQVVEAEAVVLVVVMVVLVLSLYHMLEIKYTLVEQYLQVVVIPYIGLHHLVLLHQVNNRKI